MAYRRKTKTSITKTPKKKFIRVNGKKRLARVSKERGKTKIDLVADMRKK